MQLAIPLVNDCLCIVLKLIPKLLCQEQISYIAIYVLVKTKALRLCACAWITQEVGGSGVKPHI